MKSRILCKNGFNISEVGLGSIDLLQLHCIPSSILYDGTVFDWLRNLKNEGKIKAFGASIETVEEGLFCLGQEGITSLQIIFNIFRQKPIEALLPKAEAENVSIIIRLPFEKGIELPSKIKDTYLPKGLTMAQFSQRWILDHNAVSCIIPGTSSAS